MAKAFGLVGGIIGLIGAILLIVVIVWGASFFGVRSIIPTTMWASRWAIGFGLMALAILSIVGAAYSKSKPILATIFMLGAAIGGAAIVQSWMASLPGAFLALGALFSFIKRGKSPA